MRILQKHLFILLSNIFFSCESNSRDSKPWSQSQSVRKAKGNIKTFKHVLIFRNYGAFWPCFSTHSVLAARGTWKSREARTLRRRHAVRISTSILGWSDRLYTPAREWCLYIETLPLPLSGATFIIDKIIVIY